MCHHPTMRKKGRQGSVLLIALVLFVALTAVVGYAVLDSLNASSNARREDNYARALSAAEYGAELAIGEIATGVITSGSTEGALVLGDFVTGTRTDPKLFSNAEGQAVEQRRISGLYDGQEFRVKVRSARQVYGNPDDDAAKDLIERGWLRAPENAEVADETLKAYQFRDIYEVTATALHEKAADGGRVPAELVGRPVVQAVVNFNFGGTTSKLLDPDSGLIHSEDPANFQITSTGDLAGLTIPSSSYAMASMMMPIDSSYVAAPPGMRPSPAIWTPPTPLTSLTCPPRKTSPSPARIIISPSTTATP